MEKMSKATQKYIRISPLKMNQVMKEIRGKRADEALTTLKFTNKRACRYLVKLLNSAVANAVNNHSMDADLLYIDECFANPGPILKRIRPAPMGRAFRINKRTSHNTIILKEKEQSFQKPVKKADINEDASTKAKAKKVTKKSEGTAKKAVSTKKKTEKAEVAKEEN